MSAYLNDRSVGRAAIAPLVVVLLLLSGMGFVACGGGGDSGSEELARQHEIAVARQQAAQDARQAVRVKQLEREVTSLKKGRAKVPGPIPDRERVSDPDDTGIVAGDDWPGGSGYTTILASLSSEDEALVVQAEATSAGLDAGILLSSDYPSLRPNYWVVFSGTFGGVGEAAERADRARELGYGDAYPRFVSP
jgi:hypothetical protein